MPEGACPQLKLKWIFAGLIEALFLAASFSSVFKAGVTLGTVMLWLMTLLLTLLMIFRKPLAKWTAHGFGFFCKIAFCVGWMLYFCVIGFVAVSGYGNLPDYTEKAVIVLGAGLEGDRPNSVLQDRLDRAVAYYEQNAGALIVVSGGKGSDKKHTEAYVMEQYLLTHGVPQSSIIKEERSASTKENFRYSLQLLQDNGIKPSEPIVYITNAFHSYRAGEYAKRAGFSDVRNMPAPIHLTAAPACYLREGLAVLWLWAAG